MARAARRRAARADAGSRLTLRCPVCGGRLAGADRLTCDGCGRVYPVVDGIPRLLDETLPGIGEKRAEIAGWVELAKEQGWYEPDDEVDRVLPYVCRDLGWDDRNWRANEHSFDLLLERFVRPGMRVLEVGAAKCWAAQHLIARGVEYVAADILDDPNIGLGRGAFYGDFLRVQADGEHLPFEDGAFDLVYCVATLHHALDLGRMVSELARVTRRGGTVAALNEGTRALRRSGRLVHTRWLKVASLIVLGGGIVLVAGPLVGVGLILGTDAPFWLVNVVAGVVYALAMPFVALTTAYLYFDARARHEVADETEPTELPAEYGLSV